MRLTRQLRELREVRAQTIDEVAAGIGISKSSLSRLETGQVTIRLPVLRALLQHYGVDGEQQRQYEQLNREANQRGWWQSGTELTTDAAQTVAGLEVEASSIEDYSIQVLNGLLQTREYATALLRAAQFDAQPDQIEALVDFRMRRKDRLPDLKIWSILTEECLARPIGGSAVMRQQLRYLLDLASGPGLVLQLLPPSAGPHPGIDGPFSIMTIEGVGDLNVVYVEGNGWDACIEEHVQVRAYQARFDRLRAQARSPEESLTRLEELEKDYSGD
jgi:transcriptional regulator with XRE-family HTH domain